MGMYGRDGRKAVDFSKGGRTRQSEKDACDVNLIVAQHRRGGVTAHLQQRVAAYGFVPASDFRSCMEEVRKAQEVFDALPARTRDYFSNDPARFVDFAAKPENVAELVKLGLLKEFTPEEPRIMKVEVVNPAEPSS